MANEGDSMAEATESTETVEDASGSTDKDTGGGLRKQLEASLKREKTYRTTILADGYEKLGLDPDEGLGKAIAKEYDGEASHDALAAYALAEYNYTPTQQVEQNPLAGQIAQGQAALDQVDVTAGSVAAPTQIDALAKAEAEGDYATSLAIKGQQMAEMLKPSRR